MKARLIHYTSNCLRAFTGIGLILHFAATLLYVFPANPIKMQLGFLAEATIGAYFPQNWSLFAPTPVQSTQSLLVRCLSSDELPRSSQDKLPDVGWHDVSSAHFERAHRSPVSAYERLVRPLQNSLRKFITGGPDLAPLFESCKRGDQDACKKRDAALEPRRTSALQMLRGIGSAFCRETQPASQLAGVALRFRERDAVPWSKREHPQPKQLDYELGVFSLDDTVSLPQLYAVEQQP